MRFRLLSAEYLNSAPQRAFISKAHKFYVGDSAARAASAVQAITNGRCRERTNGSSPFTSEHLPERPYNSSSARALRAPMFGFLMDLKPPVDLY